MKNIVLAVIKKEQEVGLEFYLTYPIFNNLFIIKENVSFTYKFKGAKHGRQIKYFFKAKKSRLNRY